MQQMNIPMQPPPMPPSGQEFVFPSAYGGAVRSEKPPQIHDLMRALRLEVGAVKAVKQAGGPMFPVRGAKDLAQKLADALNKLNMEAPVVAQEIVLMDTDKIPGNTTNSGKPVFRTLAHVKATVRLIAPDTSFIDMVGSGHGGDVDDKSGGKASTYAWKDAILKGLSIPHEDMVDTDDDSTTGEETPKPAKPGPGRPKKVEKPAPEGAMNAVINKGEELPPPDSKDVNYVVKQIQEAKTVEELEGIRKAIQDGVLALHGADRLAASRAFVARKKELTA